MYESALEEFSAAAKDDVGQLLAAASARLMKEAFTRLAALGHAEVHPAHVAVFTGLDPEGTRVTVLAERAGISRQAMSVLVRGLQQSGYVETRTDPTDSRATLVGLSARGEAFCRSAIGVAAELDREIEERLGRTEIEIVRRALRTLAE